MSRTSTRRLLQQRSSRISQLSRPTGNSGCRLHATAWAAEGPDRGSPWAADLEGDSIVPEAEGNCTVPVEGGRPTDLCVSQMHCDGDGTWGWLRWVWEAQTDDC